MGLFDTIAGAAKGFVFSGGNPAGAFAGAIQADQQRKANERFARQIEQRRQQQKVSYGEEYQMLGSGEFTTPGLSFTPRPTQQLGFFDRLGQIGSNVGNTLLTGLEAALPSVITSQLLGNRAPSVGQQPAVTTITNLGAQESQGSGSIQAGMGAALPSILGGARSLLKSPAGQLLIGTGAGVGASMLGSEGRSVRITRKMKSDARMVLRLTGGNIQAAANMFGVDQEFFVFVLLKRFRNDGPVVTKAALRKTKQTIRRLHSMQNVLKSITPTAAGRRKAPMKRATTTTLIKN